ncbi:MAG: phosphate uptake regulator, PhoU [Nitrososphaerales archaeon]|nr:phosphate uptake regulator, PhoU [Nitrososphaerales archaeon]
MGLEKLNSLMLEMATLSENAVAAAIEEYLAGQKSKQVDEWAGQLRSFHRQVSELSMELIARYQPVASDLRYIKACFEISYGFFRYGRYAHDIVEVLEMFGDLRSCDHTSVIDTARKTKEMIRMSIDAFTRKDVELARKIPAMDDFVDEQYRKHLRQVMEGQGDLKCSLSAALILRYLERIADHATYIGESVVYIVTGVEPAR